MKDNNEWSAPQDGLPPVGTECLVTHNGIIGWRRITVLTGIFDTPEEGCNRGAIVVYYHETCKTGLLHNVTDDDTRFRLIQSDLDKQHDELTRLAQLNIGDSEAIASIIQSHGYRKPISREEANNAINMAFKGVLFTVSQRTSLLDLLGYKD